jgi:hypothetical protein
MFRYASQSRKSITDQQLEIIEHFYTLVKPHYYTETYVYVISYPALNFIRVLFKVVKKRNITLVQLLAYIRDNHCHRS